MAFVPFVDLVLFDRSVLFVNSHDEREADGRHFRLIGVGASELGDGELADPPDLFDPERQHHTEVETAIDAVRAKLGEGAIAKGRGFSRVAKPMAGESRKP